MKLLRRFAPYIGYLAPHKWAFAGALLCGGAFGISTGFGIPYLIQKVLPELVTNQNETQLIITVLAIPLIMALRGACQFFNIYLTAYCGVRVLERVRSELFGKIQRLHLGFFSKRNKGDLLSRLLVDCNSVKACIIEVSNSLVKEPFTIIAAVCSIIWQSLRNREAAMLVLFLLSVPLCVFPIRYFGRKLTKRAVQLQRQAGDLTEVANENLSALREIRAFSLEQSQAASFAEKVRKLIKSQMRVVRHEKMVTPCIELVAGIMVAAAIYYIAKAKLAVKTDDLIALLSALFLCYDPVKKLGEINNHLRKGVAALDRVEEIINEPEAIQDPPSPRSLPARVAGKIEFRGVEFHYDESPVLHGVSCVLEPGRTYALVGPSGAGKSTFINLVLRFYDPSSGAVCLDGVDLRELRQRDLRGQIALVSQDPVLFNDTILSNIQLSCPNASRAEIEEAAKLAHAHEFIMACDQGYETIVGDRGARLSGGQKQRIALARAFLRDSPLLILDEATSALDSESESIIHDALEKLIRGKTVLMIAHRFSTLKMADEILVFQTGQIIGRGTHAELIEGNEVYRNLYEKQELP